MVAPNGLTTDTLSVIYIRKSEYSEQDWHSTMHSHYFTEMLYVTAGEGAVQFEDHREILTANSVIVVNPYVRHTEVSTADKPLSYIVLGVDDIRLAKDEMLVENFYLFTDQSKEILPLLNLMLVEDERQLQGFDRVNRQLASVVVQLFLRATKIHLVSPVDRVPRDGQLVKAYLDAHFKEHLSLESLSKALHFDKFYIIHVFKKAFNDTPMNYVTRQRIAASQDLLRNTDYAIGQIAMITGFESQSYFNQIFRAKTQMSPSAFRQAHK